MSWAQDEWKYNLPHVALQKIDALERNIDQLRKDQQQKKFKIESLEASFENQKKKTEKEKSEVLLLKKDIQSIEERCRESQNNYDKIVHDLQAKDNRISCLDGQLAKVTKSFERESTKVSELTTDLERAISDGHKKIELLQQKEQDIDKLNKKLKLSNSDDVFSSASQHQQTKPMQNEVVSLISFDEPEQVQQNVVQFANPTDPLSLKTSNSSQNSTTFNLFGDDFEHLKTIPSTPASTTTNGTGELGENVEAKVATLQEQLNCYEREADNYKTFKKDFEMKFQQIKSELDVKSNECTKIENEAAKLTVRFEEEQVKNEGLDRSLKQLQKVYECERHNSQAAFQSQEEKMKEQERQMREEIALEEKMCKDRMQAVQNQMNEVEKKNLELTREYQTLERNFHHSNTEKEALKLNLEDATHTISQLKSNHQVYIDDMKRELEDAHKKQLAACDIKLQEAKQELTNALSAAAVLKKDAVSCEKTIFDLNSKCMGLEDYKEKAEKKISQLSKLTEENVRQSATRLKELETNYLGKLKEKEESEKICSKSLKEVTDQVEKMTQELSNKKHSVEDLQFKCASFEAQLNKLKKEKEQNDKEHNIFTRETEQREKELVKNYEQSKQEAKVTKEREQIANSSLEKLRIECDQCKQKLTEAEKLSCHLQEKLTKVEDSASDMESKLSTMVSENDELVNRNKHLESEKLQWEERISEKNTVVDRLKQECESSRSERDELTGKIASMSSEIAVNEKQFAEMESTLKNVRVENERIIASVDGLKQDKDNALTETADIKTKLDQSQQASHELTKKNQTMEREFQEQYTKLKDDITCATSEIDSLRDQNARCEDAIDLLQKSKARSDAELECAAEESQQLHVECKTLKDVHDELQAVVKDISTKLLIQTERCDELQQSLRLKEQELDTLKENTSRIEQEKQIENNSLKDTIRELTIKAEELESDVQTIESQKTDLQTDNKKLSNDYHALSSELSELSVLFESLQKEKEILANEMESDKQKNEETANLLQSKETALDQLNGQLETLHDDLNLRTRSYEELLTEKNHVMAQLQMAQDELEDLNDVIQQEEEKHKSSIYVLNGKVTELDATVQEKNVHIQKLQDAIAELQTKLCQLEKALQVKEQELIESKETVSNLNEQFVSLGAQLSNVNNANATLEENVQRVSMECQQYVTRLSEKEDQISAIKGEHEQMEKDRTVQLQAKESRISELNSEMASLQEYLEGYKTQFESLNNELTELVSLKAELTTEVRDKQLDIENKQECIDQLQGELVIRKEATESLMTQVEDKNKQLEENEKCVLRLKCEVEQIDTLSALLEKKSLDLQAKENDIAEIEKRLQLEEERSRNISEENKVKCDELETRFNQIEDLQRALTEENKHSEQLSEKLIMVELELSEKDMEISNLTSSLENEMKNLEQAVREMKVFKERVEKLQDTVEHLNSGKQTLDDECRAVKTQNSKLQEENVRLTDLTDKSECERLSLLETVNALQETLLAKEMAVEQWKESEEKNQKEFQKLSALNQEIIACKDEEICAAHEEYKILNEKLLMVTNEFEGVRSSLDEQNLELSKELEQLKIGASKQTEEIKLELSKTKDELTDKEKSLDDLMNQCKETDEIILKLKTDNLTLHEKYTEDEKKLRKEFEQSKDNVAKKQGQLKALMESKATMQSKIVEYASQVDNLQNKIRQLQVERKEEADWYNQEIERLQQDCEEKVGYIQLLKESAAQSSETYEDRIQELTDSLSSSQSELEQLQDSGETYRNTITTLEQNVAELQEHLSNIKEEMSSKQTSYEELTNEFRTANEVHKATIESLEQEMSDMKQKIFQQSNDYSTEAKISEAEIRSLNEVLEETRTESQDKDVCIEMKCVQIRGLELLNTSLQANTEELQETIVESQNTTRKYEEEFREQKENLTMLKSQLEESGLKCDQIAFELKEKTDACCAKEEALNELQQAMRLLEEDFEGMEGKFKELFAERNDIQCKFTEEEVKALEKASIQVQKVKNLNIKLDDIEAKYHHVEEQWREARDEHAAEIVSLKNKICLLQNTASESESKCAELMLTLESTCDEHKRSMQATVETHVTEMDKKDEELSCRMNEISEQRKLSNERQQEISMLNNKLGDLQNTFDIISADMNSTSQLFSELKVNNDTLVSDLTYRDTQLHAQRENEIALKSELVEKTTSLENSISKITELEQQSTALQESNSATRRDHEDAVKKLHDESARLEGRVETLLQDISSITSEKITSETYLMEQKTTLEQALKLSCEEVKDLTSTCDKLNLDINSFNVENNSLNSKIVDLEGEIERYGASEIQYLDTIRVNAETIADLEGKLMKHQQEFEEFSVNANTQAAVLDGKVATAEQLLKEMEKKFAKSAEDAIKKQEKVDDLEQRLVEAKAARDAQDVESDKLKEHIVSMEKIQEDMTDNLDKFKPALENLHKDVNKLSRQKEELNAMNENLKEEIRQKHAEMTTTAETFRTEKVEMSEKLLECEKLVRERTESNEALVNALKETEKDLQMTNTSLSSAKSDNVCFQDEISELKSELSKALGVHASDAKRHEEIKTEMSQKLNEAQEQAESSSDKLKYVETVNEELAQELLEAKQLLQAEKGNIEKLQDTLKENDADFETLQEKLNGYKTTVRTMNVTKCELEEQLKGKGEKIENLIGDIEALQNSKEKEQLKLNQEIEALQENLKVYEITNEDLQADKQRLHTECNKLRVCFDTLHEENKNVLVEKDQLKSERVRLENAMKEEQNKLRVVQSQLNDEKENNICNKAEVSNLNNMLENLKTSIEKERRKIKKTTHDLEKKDISISELEKELQVRQDTLSAKDAELKHIKGELVDVQKSLTFEVEKSGSKQFKLDEIKARLLTKNSNENGEDPGVLDESVDFSSHILQLQEKIALMESDKRRCIDEAVEEEKLKIVESTKVFVMEREKSHEIQCQHLHDQLQLKQKKLDNYEAKVKHLHDECEQKDFAIQQEKHTYDKLLKTYEEKNNSSKHSRRSSLDFSGDELRELRERFEHAKAQNEELREDFAKTVDDYEKTANKEKREIDRLKKQNEKLQTQFERKDIELKRHLSLAGADVKNSKLLEDLRSKLMSSDEKYVDLQFQNEDLQKKLSSEEQRSEKALATLNKRLQSLLQDNEQLRKKLAELQNALDLMEKENVKMNKERAAYPFARSTVSPLTRSLSTLKVLSSEDDISNRDKDTDSDATSSLKSVETPKRQNDGAEKFPAKSKRVRMNSILKKDTDKSTIHGSLAGVSSRRRSSRLATKPYTRETITSSSEDEANKKSNGGENVDKENTINPFLHRTMQQVQHPALVLSPKKMNTEDVVSNIRKPIPKLDTDRDQVKKLPASTRVTRSTSAADVTLSQKQTAADTNASNLLNARRPLRSHSTAEEEEKCNMQ